MNIVLHICCAPCAIFPAEDMRRDGEKIAGFFYNPNIHPYTEYLKRRQGVEKYAKETGLGVIYPPYDLEKYFQNVQYDEKPEKRCPACWWMRLEETAKYAKENGFDAFTSTLLASPYQDQGVIKAIGEDIANRVGLKFFYRDFRSGFKAAHEAAKKKGMYCQNYCGCLFSEKERFEKKSAAGRGKGSKGNA